MRQTRPRPRWGGRPQRYTVTMANGRKSTWVMPGSGWLFTGRPGKKGQTNQPLSRNSAWKAVKKAGAALAAETGKKHYTALRPHSERALQASCVALSDLRPHPVVRSRGGQPSLFDL